MGLVDQPDGFYHMPKITKEAHYFLAGSTQSLCGAFRRYTNALIPFRCASSDSSAGADKQASGPVCRECQKRNAARWAGISPSPDREGGEASGVPPT